SSQVALIPPQSRRRGADCGMTTDQHRTCGNQERRRSAGATHRLYLPPPMSTSDSSPTPMRAALVAVQLADVDDEAFAASVAELHRLGRTLGVTVVASVIQRRASLHAAAVIGSGKLAELVALASPEATAPIEAVLVDHD